MRSELSIKVVALSLSALFAVTSLLLIVAAVLFSALPGAYGGMMAATGTGMMGITGYSWSATLVGLITRLVWAVLLGFYIAIVFVPVHNFLLHRAQAPQPPGHTAQPLSTNH